MATFTTIAQAQEYLVAQGYNPSIVAAIITEQYCGHDTLLWNASEDIPDPQDEVGLEMAYNTYVGDMQVCPEGVMYEGELRFDLNGNFL